MTELTNTMRRLRALLIAAGVALALSGCAATHVGESWQCPLAQGSQCTSVAAADPAVNWTGAAALPVRVAPLHRAGDGAGSVQENEAAGDCGRGCDPFAWIARLFTGGAPGGTDGGIEAVDVGRTDGASPESASSFETGAAQERQLDTQATSRAAADDASADGLRAPETIGRIWIAPHVDAAGVYREGSYVRIVIAPADWKRP